MANKNDQILSPQFTICFTGIKTMMHLMFPMQEESGAMNF